MQVRKIEVNKKKFFEYLDKSHSNLMEIKKVCKGPTWIHSDFDHFIFTGEWRFKLTEEVLS